MYFGFVLQIVLVILVYCVISLQENEAMTYFFWQNLILQNILFVLVACIPAYFTKKMMYVDVAWPWGLVMLTIQGYIYGNGEYGRKDMICLSYLIHGGRMALGGLTIFYKKNDFPRYIYAQMKWQEQGIKDNTYVMMADIMTQCLANCGILALPLFQICFDQELFSYGDCFFFAYFSCSLFFEHSADLQKIEWLQHNKQSKGFCKEGLWYFCRHPNYFGEWNCWNAYSCWTIFSLIRNNNSGFYLSFILSIGISANMYYCLVYWTGAIPAEYYSSLKRQGYKEYQKTTNQFFPWFPKTNYLKL